MAAEKPMTIDEAMKVHEAFRPLLLSKMLRQTLAEITAHRKDTDDSQVKRLELALAILKVQGVDMPAYPDKTYTSLVAQMNKQMDKILKKKDKKDKKKGGN